MNQKKHQKINLEKPFCVESAEKFYGGKQKLKEILKSYLNDGIPQLLKDVEMALLSADRTKFKRACIELKNTSAYIFAYPLIIDL